MPANAFSNYPGGFSHGVTLRGLSVLNVHYGNIFWVDSGIGNDSGGADGSISKPFATIDYAVGRCTADNGDIIVVAPGHTETISAAGGIDLDVSGISVIGLGNGRERPTINFTATGSDIDIDAANIYVENLHLDMTGIDAVAAGIDVNAANFSLVGCDILMADSGGQATRGIAGATAADRMKIIGNTVRSTTAGAASFVNLVGTADDTEIAHNYIYGDFSVAAIENATLNVCTNLDIHDNYIQNDNNGNWAIELVSASTGTIRNNNIVTDAIATAVDWGSCSAFGNLYFDDGDTDSAGTAIPTAQTTGGMDLQTIADRLGSDADTDAIAAMLGGAAGIATIPAAAVPANAVNVFELLRQIWANECGTAANENGIASWPAAAAYANNVSIAEVAGYIQDGVRRGTGTTLPANTSLADYAEAVATTAAAVIATGTATIFTIAGGPIEVQSLLSVCITSNDGTATLLKYTADPTNGAATDLSIASASLGSATAGTTAMVTGTFGAAPTISANGVVAAGTTKFIVTAGVIQTITTGGATSGTWTHHLRYQPLAKGITIT